MSKTREILELAAKAMGLPVHESDDGTVQCRPILVLYHYVQGQPYSEYEWNPLRNSGQCADMEAQLSIDIEWKDEGGLVWASQWSKEVTLKVDYAETNGDKQAARRLASTRCAAEIGMAK